MKTCVSVMSRSGTFSSVLHCISETEHLVCLEYFLILFVDLLSDFLFYSCGPCSMMWKKILVTVFTAVDARDASVPTMTCLLLSVVWRSSNCCINVWQFSPSNLQMHCLSSSSDSFSCNPISLRTFIYG